MVVHKFRGGFDHDMVVKHTIGDRVRYISRLHGKQYWICMDKLSDYNYNAWQKFARTQSNSRTIDYNWSLDNNFNGDGSAHFARSLRENYQPDKHDLYVCFITQSKPLTDSFDINFDDVMLFMSVITNNDAKIGTHLGISLTTAGLRQKRSNKKLGGLSLPAHAFAAQVLKIINPSIKLMINAPIIFNGKYYYESIAK